MGRSRLSPGRLAEPWIRDSAPRRAPQRERFDTLDSTFLIPLKSGIARVPASAFLKHYFRGLNHRGNRIADFEIHFLGAALGNHALNRIFAHADRYVSHHAINLKFN